MSTFWCELRTPLSTITTHTENTMYSLWSFYVIKNGHTTYLELDDTTEIAYEWLSPMWCRETSATWDFTLPRTPHNAEALLPAFPNGELYPLNEGHHPAYITGLPWQEEEEAYWGLLTVVATTERRIRVQFLQKSLFEQELDKPAKNVDLKWHGSHYVLARESDIASGLKGHSWEGWRPVIIAWNIHRLLEGYISQLEYQGSVSTDPFQQQLYLVSNHTMRASVTKYRDKVLHGPKRDIGANDFTVLNYAISLYEGAGGNLHERNFRIPMTMTALSLVRQITALCCMAMIIKEYASGKGDRVDFTYNNRSNRDIYLGDLSAYEWVKAYYPDVPECPVKAQKQYTDACANYLIPTVAYEEGQSVDRREYPYSSHYYTPYNDIADGAPFGYEGTAEGCFYYTPWTDFPFYYAYFQKPESLYQTKIYLPAASHLCDCTPTPTAVATSQYGVDNERGTWVYEGEHTIPLPRVKGRGAQNVAISFARTHFVGTNIRTDNVTLNGDSLLNGCDRIVGIGKLTGVVFYHLANFRDYAQHIGRVKFRWENGKMVLPDTAYKGNHKGDLETWLYNHGHTPSTKPPNPDEHDGLPLPPNWKRGGGGGGGNGKGGRHNFSNNEEGLRHIPSRLRSVALRGSNLSGFPDDVEPYTRFSFKQDLFHAIGTLALNTFPPQPTLAVDSYNSATQRAEKLFLVGRELLSHQVNIHPRAKEKLGFYADRWVYSHYELTNNIRIADTVKRYFRHMWHAVEGNLSAWDEAEVFAAMTEYTYPVDGDTNHIRNQRVKKVSLTLRRGECRIRAVRVIQFNHEASDAEWEAMLKG